jgi:hypothetical protein
MVEEDQKEFPLSTVPEGLPINMRNHPDEKTARAVGNFVQDVAISIGQFFVLSELDGKTVFLRLQQRFSWINRGVEGLKPFKKKREHAFGVAMTPAVMRDGQIKSHVLI